MVGGVEDCTNRACRVIIFDVLNISAWSEVQIYYPSNHRFAQVRAEPNWFPSGNQFGSEHRLVVIAKQNSTLLRDIIPQRVSAVVTGSEMLSENI